MNKKERILATSIKLFVLNGIDATTTASIAKEAKVATGLLFHHFGNKETLIKHLFQYTKARLAKAVGRTKLPAEFSEELFRQQWFRLLDITLKRIDEVTFLRRVVGSKYIQSGERNVGIDVLHAHRAFFESGKAKGLLKELDADFLSCQVFEQLLFIASYVTDQSYTERDVEKIYQVSRDMVFTS